MRGVSSGSFEVAPILGPSHKDRYVPFIMPHLDLKGRPLGNLRLSVTDRCNLRCGYCMPEEEYSWLPRKDLLSFEEMVTLVRVFGSLGVHHLRITGGEPLLRRDLPALIEQLAVLDFLGDLALTTNGVLLENHAEDLAAAGLKRITVSLDTLHPERFTAMTRRRDHAKVMDGIEAARSAGLPVKIDTVMIRGQNDDELFELLRHAKEVGAEIRFIEYMDVGGATRWSFDDVLPRAEMLERIGTEFGAVSPEPSPKRAPADRYRLEDGTVFGIISSTTQPFCGSCNRSRLTADGMWYRCLYAHVGSDLRGPLREGQSFAQLAEFLSGTWSKRDDQGAVDRLALHDRSPLADPSGLRGNPHLEMHTRGG